MVSQENVPVDNATVEFQIYNYAEFYPLQRCITVKTDCAPSLQVMETCLSGLQKEIILAIIRSQLQLRILRPSS